MFPKTIIYENTHKKMNKKHEKKNYFCKSLLSSVSFDLILSLSYFFPGDFSASRVWTSGKEEKDNALTPGVKAVHG